MPENLNTRIGFLTEIRSSQFLARLLTEQEGFEPAINIGGETILVGQVGSYVTIRQDTINVIALVTRVSEIRNKNVNADLERLLTLIPLGEVNGEGFFQRGVRRFPTPGAQLHALQVEGLKAIFKQFERYQFSPGYLPLYPSLGVQVNPEALFGRHFAILGQSGAGKSWAVASLLQRAVSSMPKAHVILLDLHGEYCWQDESENSCSAFREETVRHVDARRLEIPYWLMTYAELVDLLIDRSDSGASIQTAFLRETIYKLKKKVGIDLGLNEQTVSIDSPIYFSLIELYDEFKDANEQRGDFGKTTGPLYGQFDEFLIKLQSRLNDVRYDFLLKPKRRNNSRALSGLLRDFVGLGELKRQITVIDLSSVPFDVRPSVSAQIGRLAFEFNYWNPRNREFPILLVCEEAHAYIPRDSETQYEGTRKSMERIAKEGRKYGVGLGVVSQRPHELSETVLSQCGTFICLRITNPDDQSYVRDLVPESEGDLVDTLSSLGRGEAMILGEAAPLPTRFQFHRPEPTPNSNDVGLYEMWRSGPDDLDVDSIVQRWWRQGR